MKHVKIVRTYEADDAEFLSDVLEVSLSVDGQQVMTGDWYHNKIDEKISGFLKALSFLGVAHHIETVHLTEPTDDEDGDPDDLHLLDEEDEDEEDGD